MKILNSIRARVVVVAMLVAVLYIVLSISPALNEITFLPNNNINLFKSLVLGVFLYFGTAWALFFKVKGERFITVLLFPALTIFSLMILIQLIENNLMFEDLNNHVLFLILFSLFLGFFSYILVLTVNLINLKYIDEVPLTQVARATVFIISILDIYLICFILFSLDISIVIEILAMLVVTIILTYISLSTIDYKINNKLLITFSTSILLAFLYFVLSMWAVQAQYSAFIISIFYYISLSMALENRLLISKIIWVEYLLLFIIALVLLIVLSEWGINGHIF